MDVAIARFNKTPNKKFTAVKASENETSNATLKIERIAYAKKGARIAKSIITLGGMVALPYLTYKNSDGRLIVFSFIYSVDNARVSLEYEKGILRTDRPRRLMSQQMPALRTQSKRQAGLVGRFENLIYAELMALNTRKRS